MDAQFAPPDRVLLLRESRTIGNTVRMIGRLLRPVRTRLDSDPVIVLPGFGAGERSMRPLRHYLGRCGIAAEDWGLGLNKAGLDIPHALEDIGPTWEISPITPYRREGGVPFLCDRMVNRTRQRAEELGSKLILIGWSLGGTIAREVARDAPDAVSQVITLGSPVVGGPKYTAAGSAFARRRLNLDWIESEVRRRDSRPITVPITAIVSPTDGIVGFNAAMDRLSPNVRHVELDVPHLGMGVNPTVWDVIIDSIEKRGPANRE